MSDWIVDQEHVRQVLVVDDSPLARRNAQHVLEGAGYQVVEAVDRQEAMRILAAGGIDLVLLDLLLPDTVSEVELVSMVCKAAAGAPVIVVSANVQAQVQEVVSEAGAVGFIAKPYSEHELLVAVQRNLEE